jgi:AAA domain
VTGRAAVDDPVEAFDQPCGGLGTRAVTALEAPIVSDSGNDVVLTWPRLAVTISAIRRQIRDNGGSVRAELNFLRGARHLHQADFALASTAGRRTEVKALEEMDRDVPWRDLLAYACRVLVDYSRATGHAAVELRPRIRTGERYAVAPVVLASGCTVVCGDGGAGKGWAALTLAAAVATGTTIAGLGPTRRGRVYYADWEAEDDDQAERIAYLGRGLNIPISGLYYRRMATPLPDAVEDIQDDIRSIGDVALLIIDSLMPASGGGGDRSWHDVSASVFAALRTFKPPQLVLAHLSRADAARPGTGARPFGSVFNTNFPRSVWEWRRADGAPDELVAGLYHIKANNTPLSAPLGLRFTFEPSPAAVERVVVFRHDLAQEPDLIARAGLRDQLRAALKGGAQSVAALAEALGKNEASIRKTLGRMADKHIVTKLPDGTWGITA